MEIEIYVYTKAKIDSCCLSVNEKRQMKIKNRVFLCSANSVLDANPFKNNIVFHA